MPFIFLLLGVAFLIVAVRGTQDTLFGLLKSEFVGTNSFVPWISSILILGALGYAKPIRPVAHAMIGLIILTMILTSKGGVFSKFNQAIRNPVAPAQAPATGSTGTSIAVPSYGNLLSLPYTGGSIMQPGIPALPTIMPP